MPSVLSSMLLSTCTFTLLFSLVEYMCMVQLNLLLAHSLGTKNTAHSQEVKMDYRLYVWTMTKEAFGMAYMFTGSTNNIKHSTVLLVTV